jgi:iron complex transport system ATP-binding protein
MPDDIILQTAKLSIGYRAARQPPRRVADSLNLALRAGELVCLLGPNGAGKSTLLRTLAGMLPPLGGQMLLHGQNLAHLTPRDIAQRLSVVLTDRIDVGNLSAYALVALGRHPYTDWLGRLSDHDEASVHNALAAVDAVALAERQMHELSDGERQRVMIARALAQDPLVMLLDEPTAFLDLPRRVEMMRLLRRLAHTTGRALLLSTHDLDLALRSADVLWLMETGGHLHTGAPEDLVLSGAFAATFHREGVTFDPATGTFQMHPTGAERVALAGTGIAHFWTARALERAGFAVVPAEAQADAWVVVEAHEHSNGESQQAPSGSAPIEPYRWRCRIGSDTAAHTLTSVYELVALLRAHASPRSAPPPAQPAYGRGAPATS